MLSVGTGLDGRVRFLDTRRVLNPHMFRAEFARVSELIEDRRRGAAPKPRDPDALCHDLALTYGIATGASAGAARATPPISRWDAEDFRFRDPAAFQRLIGVLLDASGAASQRPTDAPRLRLNLRLVRAIGDPSGKWLPYAPSGVLGRLTDDDAATVGWLCLGRENVDGGRFQIRRAGTREPWIQKELSVGYAAVVAPGTAAEWQMSPVFSWDSHYTGAVDIVYWTLAPSRSGSMTDLTEAASAAAAQS